MPIICLRCTWNVAKLARRAVYWCGFECRTVGEWCRIVACNVYLLTPHEACPPRVFGMFMSSEVHSEQDSFVHSLVIIPPTYARVGYDFGCVRPSFHMHETSVYTVIMISN